MRRLNFTGIALAEEKATVVNHGAEARAAGIFNRLLNNDRRDVVRFNADLRMEVHSSPGILLHFLPEVEIKSG